MSVAFAVEVTPSAGAARWRCVLLGIPAAGLALTGLQLASGPTVLHDAAPALAYAAVAGCGAGALGLAVAALGGLRRRPGRRPGAPRDGAAGASGDASARAEASRALVVDEEGRPALREGRAAAPRPMSLRAWCMLPGLTLLVLAPYAPQPAGGRRARPVTLVLGRDAVSDEAWRRLHVWLRWNDRGRTDRQTLGPHRT